MKIVITSPTGNIGNKLIKLLLDQGEKKLILLARNAEKLEEEQARGAIVVEGDLYDVEYVKRATRDVDVLFWVAPHNYATKNMREDYRILARNAAAAIRENGIRRVVHLSSNIAHRSEKGGPANGLHDAEEILNQTDANITHLQPGFFMENFPNFAGDGIQKDNTVYFPISGSVRITMIAGQDIATEAARVIQDASWEGKCTIQLDGAADVSFDEAAAAIGKALGRKIKHVQVTPAQAREAMIAKGVSEEYATQMVELFTGFESGWLLPAEPRSKKSTTPTTISDFTNKVIAPAIQAQTVGTVSN